MREEFIAAFRKAFPGVAVDMYGTEGYVGNGAYGGHDGPDDMRRCPDPIRLMYLPHVIDAFLVEGHKYTWYTYVRLGQPNVPFGQGEKQPLKG